MYYKATLVGPNKVYFEIPAVNFYLRNEHKLVSLVEGNQKIKEARAVTRNILEDEPHRLVRRVMLVFPENFVLSNKHYSKHSEEDFGPVVRKDNPIFTSFKLGGANIDTNSVHVTWKVTVLDSKERCLAKKETPKKETIEDLAERWKDMKLSAKMDTEVSDDDDDNNNSDSE